MKNCAVLYGKLAAFRDKFLDLDDVEYLKKESDYNVMLSLLSKRLNISLDEDVSPLRVRYKIVERFLNKVNTLRFYLSSVAFEVLSFLLYRYDIYNLKVLLTLHFANKDIEVSKFIYKETLLYPRYAFLMERNVIVDKDILLAFKGTPIFPFLADTYRYYKEQSDIFFLDTVLEDGYYQTLLKIVASQRSNDAALLNLLKYILFIHNVLWGMRLKYIYGFQWGQIYYYLVLPIPGVSTDTFVDLFSASDIDAFVSKLKRYVQLFYKLNIEADRLENNLEKLEDTLNLHLLAFLWKQSKLSSVTSLSGIVAWMFAQDMLIDSVEQILYEKWILQQGVEFRDGVIVSR